MQSAIKIENLSKQYRLGLVGTGTLSHDINRWWHLMRGKEDPYLRIGETNDRSTIGYSEYVWALKDINLEIDQGEVFGIIGRNGAGKSTLLKLLSKVTTPTTGKITYKGRISSLLEVGTGFNPELTGRENIYLNGSILGMRRKEIDQRFDDIVDFSGCARYIDTPIKRYSSGMTVRLGFSVAAFLEPEILVIDEVLAVGDVDFQKKAVAKMKEVSRSTGKTILFVSHNLNSITNLCPKSMILQNGSILDIGSSEEMIKKYLTQGLGLSSILTISDDNYPGDNTCKLKNAKVVNGNCECKSIFYLNEDIIIEFTFELFEEVSGAPNIHLTTFDGIHILFSAEKQGLTRYEKGSYTAKVQIPKNTFNTGSYIVSIAFSSYDPSYIIHFNVQEALTFDIMENMDERVVNFLGVIPGIIRPEFKWELKKIS